MDLANPKIWARSDAWKASDRRTKIEKEVEDRSNEVAEKPLNGGFEERDSEDELKSLVRSCYHVRLHSHKR
jgi:hypothetical protein